MNFVPLSLVEGLQPLLQLSQVIPVLSLQCVQRVLQSNAQLLVLLFQTLRRMDGGNWEDKISSW